MNGWLGVVSRAHVLRGLAGGFAQVNHGKAAPLRRMKAGDVLAYYSPATEMGGAPLQAFTAIGRIEDDEVFPFDMGGGFVPSRRRVRYASAREAPLAALKDRLELCAADHWGVALRRGLLPLSAHDLAIVADAMGVGSAFLEPHAARPHPPGREAARQAALW